jgi:hypothetical protein
MRSDALPAVAGGGAAGVWGLGGALRNFQRVVRNVGQQLEQVVDRTAVLVGCKRGNR